MPALTEFYIDGAWTAPSAPKTLDVINPATEEPCATISMGAKADVDRAVAAAKKAFETWGRTTPAERRAYLVKLVEVYESRAEEMAQAISKEMGAPIAMARNAQASSGSSHLRAFIRVMDDFTWEHPLRDDAQGEYIVHEPIGVAGLITPWNWPMNQVALKVGAALAAGCTMVLKPSEIAPLSSMLFAEFVDQAGIPKGVFNLVN
ncbi:MAG: aldehyde dehydrogenase family protein, partial [Alphaproteobacteria bacterium]|nr:aldehyde dehydrogenase family protein [Alphaproteobacteria bacterium]